MVKKKEVVKKVKEAPKKQRRIKSFVDNVISLKEACTFLKFTSIFFRLLNILFIVLVLFASITMINTTNKLGLDNLEEDEFIVDFVRIADTSEDMEITDIIENYNNKTLFITLEIVIPTVIIIVVLVSFMLFWKYLYMLVDKVETNEQLFTKKKLEILKRMKNIMTLALLVFVLLFGIIYILLWALIEVAMEAFVYIFDYGVNKTN